MNKRALILGLLVAFLTGVISQALLHGQKAIATDVALYTPYYISPVFSLLIQATSMLAWAAPGFYIGYLCKGKPTQHGATLGATYGILLGITAFAINISESSSIGSMLMFAISVLTQIAKYSVLFALAAPAGHLLATHRASP